MNRKLLASIALGFVFGIICALMSLIFKPVERITLLGLLGVIFNRTLIGLFIPITTFPKSENLRGILIGFLISYTMTLPYYGLYGIIYALYGSLYGFLISLILRRIEKWL